MMRVVGLCMFAAFLSLAPPLLAAEDGPDSPAAAPRNDAWKIIGPGGGGAQFYPTVSPVDPDTVMVRCDMTGSYITKNGGESWRMCCFRGTSSGFIFDPVDPDVIYVRGRGLYRSADGGATWELLHPDPENVEGIGFYGDHAGERFSVSGDQGYIGALAVDPADSRTLYAVISGREKAQLRISNDWGETWSSLGDLPSRGWQMQIYVDQRSPKGSRTVYVLGAGTVSVLEAGAWRHHGGPEGVRLGSVTAGFPSEGGRLVIYGFAGGWRGGSGDVHVSRDGGETWELANGDLYSDLHDEAEKPGLRAIATCLNDADVVYLSYRGYRTGPSDDENFMGVARTTDGGKTWKLVWKDTFETPGENSKGAWLNERFGPDWGENPISLGVAPTNPDICFATDLGRTMYTRDGGKTWPAAYSRRMDDGSWTTTGLDVTTNYGVHFDPFDKNRTIISYTDIGAFASDNGGVSWRSATIGVPDGWVNTTYWLVFDPDVKGRVWGVTGSAHDLPRPKMWRRMDPGRYQGGVILSDDGGRTWRPWSRDMPQTAMTHIILDPESPKEARVLYATGFGTGVWKSTDGGKTWALKNKGLPEHEPFAWWISRDRNGVLYLIIARRSDDGSYGNELDGALYRSKDGAENWEKIELPEGLNGPNGLAIDPEDPGRLYLAVWGRTGGQTGGIWLSTDAGESWEWIFDEDRFVYDVTIDPRDPNILYACGFSSSAWRSEDRGKTWGRIKGYNFKWGHRVVPDPYNPDMVYVTTFGGSVWYGPAKGDPDAAEDIVTPVATPGNLWGEKKERR